MLKCRAYPLSSTINRVAQWISSALTNFIKLQLVYQVPQWEIHNTLWDRYPNVTNGNYTFRARPPLGLFRVVIRSLAPRRFDHLCKCRAYPLSNTVGRLAQYISATLTHFISKTIDPTEGGSYLEYTYTCFIYHGPKTA